MSQFRSPTGKRLKPYSYENFMGLDLVRDFRALETGKDQHLIEVSNCFCDYTGTIEGDPGMEKQTVFGNAVVNHINFFGRDMPAWAQMDGGGITLKSITGHTALEVWPRDSIVTSTVFNKKLHFAARGHEMQVYDGVSFKTNQSASKPKPAYVAAIQRRLAAAGMPGYPTEIWFSSVDDENQFPLDIVAEENNVLAPSLLDIRNLLGTADEIKALGVFETNRLAVFTNDQTIIYAIDPDLTKWALDDKANIRYGCIGHNTVAQVGTDLFFCSRGGIHSLKRSDANGTTIYSIPMSVKIEHLYKALVQGVGNAEKINAFYDQDHGQYHIMFPRTESISSRLTLSLTPIAGAEHRWSIGNFLSPRCGTALGGTVLFGSAGGVYRKTTEQESADTTKNTGYLFPEAVIRTPMLWLGSIIDKKQTHSYILQASGFGKLKIEAFNEELNRIYSEEVRLEDDGSSGDFRDLPLPLAYERRFEHNLRGVIFKITGTEGIMKITGISVVVEIG